MAFNWKYKAFCFTSILKADLQNSEDIVKFLVSSSEFGVGWQAQTFFNQEIAQTTLKYWRKFVFTEYFFLKVSKVKNLEWSKAKLRSTLFPHSYNKLFDFSFSRRASVDHTPLRLGFSCLREYLFKDL